ncbi:MAG: MORN motif-containing protein, partial [Trichodesmium sp. St7_bin2_1]|nr:MORN motif-containing protein [Trichodesmium sp. St7_bin2_1]
MWYPQPLIAQERAEAPFCQGNPPTGRVKCNYPNGDNYTGDFVNGRPQGSGVYVYANRDRYEGQFRNGLPNGQGTFIFSNDARVKGVFQNGQIRSGTITFENGDRFVGDF